MIVLQQYLVTYFCAQINSRVSCWQKLHRNPS
jgi:hypothetical protein